MMRIGLVAPKWNEMVNSYPPLGLGYLAAFLEQRGHQVRIFDLGLHPESSLEDDVAEIMGYAPDVVGLTAMTSNYQSALETAYALKEAAAVPVVIGGPHATLFPERVLSESCFDYSVLGEGEITLTELVTAMEKSSGNPSASDLAEIEGLCFKEGERVVCNAPRSLTRDLDSFPFPARHLFEMERYPLYTPDGKPMITLLSSRGCPHNCSYCFKGIMGRTYRQRSVDSIVQEIHEIIESYGVRNLYFIDDLFTVNKARLHEFAQRAVAEDLEIRWQCLVRVDRIDEESLTLMHQAGCREVHYGIESGNQEMLERIGKGITISQVRQAVTWARNAGIHVKGYFMLGLPGDTEETMEETIRFAEELDLDEAMFSLTTPFPGTRLWDDLCEKHPGTEYSTDFTKAYYYNSYQEEIDPFMNLSEVSDRRLAQLIKEANQRFWESKRKHKYIRTLGKPWGAWLWQLSRISWIRALGQWALNRGLSETGDNLRKGSATSWS